MTSARQREAARVWGELIEQARRHGEAVEAGAVIEKFVAASFVRTVSQAGKCPFPLQHVSAQAAGKAFLGIAQAFVTAAREEDRLAIGRFMVAGSRCVDAILTAHAHAQADVWRRNFPDEEL
jgi:hypothetical protein